MEKDTRLIIGISCTDSKSKSVQCMKRKIYDAGAFPYFLRPPATYNDPAFLKNIAKIDALVVMGNNHDIDPDLYVHRCDDPSKKTPHRKTKNESIVVHGRMRARCEALLIKRALSTGIPILGICGGMQRINVILGGTLHQHLPDLVGTDKHMQGKYGIPGHVPVVPITITVGTLLAKIAHKIALPSIADTSLGSGDTIMENSFHHQAIDTVGGHLRVCATSHSVESNSHSKHLIEAIEADPEGIYANQFLLGVQWHPEYCASQLGGRIITHLVKTAGQFRKLQKKRISTNSLISLRTACSQRVAMHTLPPTLAGMVYVQNVPS